MTKTIRILMALMALAAVLVRCGPSQEELDAQATEAAAALSATQTAEAPTPTHTPTLTPTPKPTPTPTSTPTPEPTPTPLSAQSILDATTAALEEVQSYHFVMDMEIEVATQGMTMTMPALFVGDYQAPDRFQFVMTMTVLGQTTVVDAITIGDESHVKNPLTGEWEIATESVFPISPEDLGQVDPGLLGDLTFVGDEILDDVPVRHLHTTLKAADLFAEQLGATDVPPEGTFAVDYWIGAADDLFRQIQIDGSFSASEAGQEMAMDMVVTMTFSNFDEPVSITFPPEE